MQTFNILEHGAVGDGKTRNTDAFARALAACAAAGGGRVLVPPGTYLTGPIRLISNIDFHVESGATILFSREFADYPLVVTDFEGEQTIRCMSPVSGEHLSNVSITGGGTFDGQGEAWRPVKKKKLSEAEWSRLIAGGGAVDDAGEMWFPSAAARDGAELVRRLRESGRPPRAEDYAPAREHLRPNMVKLSNCRGVVIDGPTFRNSAAWNVHLVLCENVAIKNVTVLNEWNAQNGDALDLDACRNVSVSHSLFDAGDDAICLKSGKDEAGRRRGRACENITIENCTVLRGHGGVTIGSEMSGGVRNVRVSNCIFRGTDIGLRFKTTRGRGGVVEDIDISDVAMHNIRCEAISINMFYWTKGPPPPPQPVTEATPVFRDFRIRNIVCHGAECALEIRGLPEMPVESVTFEDMRITARRGAKISDAKGVSLTAVKLDIAEGPSIQCHSVGGLKMDRVETSSPAETITERVGDL